MWRVVMTCAVIAGCDDPPKNRGTGANVDGSVACGTSAWNGYGADAQRTGATDACLGTQIRTAWRYVPTPPTGKALNVVYHATADETGAYLQWAAELDNTKVYIGQTNADRVTQSGQRMWTAQVGHESNMGHWATLAFDSLILNDDQIAYVDLATGQPTHMTDTDYAGETVFDGTRLIAVNEAKFAGPGLFIGAYDQQLSQLWRANDFNPCYLGAADRMDGLAVDGGMVFYVADYVGADSDTQDALLAAGLQSGLYAFDLATGAKKWFQPLAPGSKISAGANQIYLVESDTLVARGQKDGERVWMVPAIGAGAQAPVLALGLTIIGTSSGVSAFDQGSGKLVWSAPAEGVAVSKFSFTFQGSCSSPNGLFDVSVPLGGVGLSGSDGGATQAFYIAQPTTTMAAALGSRTLVVTASDSLQLLNLADGSRSYRATIDMEQGRVRDPIVVGSRIYVVDTAMPPAENGGLLAIDTN